MPTAATPEAAHALRFSSVGSTLPVTIKFTADAPGRENFYQIASGFQSIADFRYGATARGVRNAAPIAEPSHFRIEVRRYYEICA